MAYLPSALLALGMLLCAPLAFSDSELVAGVSIPKQVNLQGEQLVLNGTGLRTYLGLKVYVAALYVPERYRSAEQILARDAPRRLQLTLLRDTSAEQNLDALKTGLVDNNSPAEMRVIAPELGHFLDLLRQVQQVAAGTNIQLDYLPRQGTHLTVGNKYLGRIAGEPFNRALLKIWLGDDPIQLSLKKALLGQDRPAL